MNQSMHMTGFYASNRRRQGLEEVWLIFLSGIVFMNVYSPGFSLGAFQMVVVCLGSKFTCVAVLRHVVGERACDDDVGFLNLAWPSSAMDNS